MMTIIHWVTTLGGCKHIKNIKLESCRYVDNRAIPYLSLIQDSLTNLEIIKCKSIDDDGLRELTVLKYVIYIKMNKIYLTKCNVAYILVFQKSKTIEN